MKKPVVWILAAVVAAAVAGIVICARIGRAPTQTDLEREFERMEPNGRELDDFKDVDIPFGDAPGKPAAGKRAAGAKARPAAKVAKEGGGDEDDEASGPTAEEKAEAEAEKLVEAFDGLTDKWMKPTPDRPPTMADIDAFVEQFRKVPADRKDECIHRALNLIPDENVMLLAGVLMDKEQSSETIDAVFSDILNRDESVKLPVLREVIKDTRHQCWKDAAWILDVTRQTPAAGGDAADGEPADGGGDVADKE